MVEKEETNVNVSDHMLLHGIEKYEFQIRFCHAATQNKIIVLPFGRIVGSQIFKSFVSSIINLE